MLMIEGLVPYSDDDTSDTSSSSGVEADTHAQPAAGAPTASTAAAEEGHDSIRRG